MLREIDALIGTLLSFPSMNDGNAGDENYTARLREIWNGLGEFAPLPETPAFLSTHEVLTSDVWSAEVPSTYLSTHISDLVSPRHQIWPVLERLGFTEFTERLAHRASREVIEVIEVLPLDSYEKRTNNLPSGLFRVGVGVFWPELGSCYSFRMTSKGVARPRVAECHLSNWLTPRRRRSAIATSAFDSIEDALEQLQTSGMQWLSLMTNAKSGMEMLRRSNWELFWSFPMMRSCGDRLSPRRLLYLAYLASKLGMPGVQTLFLEAKSRLSTWTPEHYRAKYEPWFEQLTSVFIE